MELDRFDSAFGEPDIYDAYAEIWREKELEADREHTSTLDEDHNLLILTDYLDISRSHLVVG